MGRVRLRLRTPNGVWANYVLRTQAESRCAICNARIALGAPSYVALSLSAERICVYCGDPRVIEENALRCTVITIAWDNDLDGDEVRRLSRAWALEISEQPVVAQVHTETFGTATDLVSPTQATLSPPPSAPNPRPGRGRAVRGDES